MRRMLTSFVRNTVFANLLLVMIVFAGIASAGLMIREVLPSFAIENVIVRVPYPGAGPEEVEEGISLKIEDAIEGVQGIKRYTTSSAEGLATAIIEVKTGESVQVVKDRVTDRINAILTFPEDAEKPSISEMVIRRDTIVLSVTGDVPEWQLKELARSIKDELVALPQVSQVELQGTRDYEISIEVSERELRRYGLTLERVAALVRQSSLNMPGGEIRTQGEDIKIRTMGRGYTGNEYADLVLIAREDGTSLRLGQIATIRDTFVDDDIIVRHNGRPAVAIWVYNNDDEDGLNIGNAVLDYAARKSSELKSMGLEGEVSVETWLNSSRFIIERIELLLRNGVIGLCLVFLLLWIFLDLRLAFWVSLGIPISLSGALFLMFLVGETINMISLFAMIMVLGIIVDDAIVVGEAIYVHRRRGDGPIRAAVEGTMEVAMPVIAAVTTTCVAFVPMLFVEGLMGKFVKVIPTVVICALLVSLLEGLIILPAHLNHLPDMVQPRPRRYRIQRIALALRERMAQGLEVFVVNHYGPMLRALLSWRYATFAGVLAILFVSIGLLHGGFLKFIFFPDIDTSYVHASVEFPEGTPSAITHDAVVRMERALFELERELPTTSGGGFIVGMQTSVGLPDIEYAGVAGLRGKPHYGQVFVEMKEAEQRGIHYRDIVRQWEERIGPIAGALSLRIRGFSGGPPGNPIEVWLLGDDLNALRAAADGIKQELQKFAGVFQIEDDFRPGKREMRARLKPEARTLGLTTADLARQLRAGFYGEEVVRVQRGRDEVKVWVRYPDEERRSMAQMDGLRIRTPDGREVPLSSVADIAVEEGYTTISRVDGQRRVRVTADVFTEVANPGEVLDKLSTQYLTKIPDLFPGVTASIEGEKRDSQESFSSLYIGFPLAILAIYLIIASLFGSYIQPVVILFTVPFGIIGALWGHFLLGYELTMMSMFGIVALAGVVVNDAIVLIEAINVRLARGMGFAEAIVEGGCRRFRAILLTTATTVGGLTPLILEPSFQAQFLIPMALTIASGVAFATILTLIVVPCLLYILNDLRLAWHWFRTGRTTTREDVEPASHRHDDPDHEEELRHLDAGVAPRGVS
jgi:multidrug efflux pump subunit AcrB